MIYDGRIVDIEKNTMNAIFVKQGVPGHKQYLYSGYPGGNGTYVIGGETSPMTLDLVVFIFDHEIHGIPKVVTIDIREYVQQLMGWRNITSGRFDTIYQNKGRKVKVHKTSSGWALADYSVLVI